MKISKKINPDKLEATAESAARTAFITTITEMRTLPPPQNIEFYIRINFQFVGDKAADSCLLVLGEQSAAWKSTIKSELKADKKQVLIGLAGISKDGKLLQLQINLGAAKKSIVRKGLKAWCNKVGLKLDFSGGEPDPEDVDTEEELEEKIEMRQSNTTVKANEDAALLAKTAAQAANLLKQSAAFASLKDPALGKMLYKDLPLFLADYQQLAAGMGNIPPNLAKAQQQLQSFWDKLSAAAAKRNVEPEVKEAIERLNANLKLAFELLQKSSLS